MRIVITALEQSFLSGEPGALGKAESALTQMRERKIPLIFCSSASRTEVESFRAKTGNVHPFIVEDGAALLIPTGYFPFSSSFSTRSGQFEILKFGERRDVLMKKLREASKVTGVEVAAVNGSQSGSSRTWEYRECFTVLSGDPKPLLQTLEGHHCRCTENAGVYTLTGNNDKSLAIMTLIRFFFQTSRNVIAVGLGRPLTDADLLKSVDIPILIRPAQTEDLKGMTPEARSTESSGLEGWVEAIAHVLGTGTAA